MSSMNDPYSSDATHAHDDVDYEALELAQFEQSAAAREHEPGHLVADTEEAARLGDDKPDIADGSPLARHGDPSSAGIAPRRARLEQHVRDRRGVRWVPAAELMRHGTAKLAGQSINLHAQTHRAARDAAVKAVMRGGVVASERLQRLGQARPLRAFSAPSAMRNAPGR